MIKKYILKDWIPYQLDFQTDELLCKWLFISDKNFSEPFFHETTALCKVYEENRQIFKSVSTLSGMREFAQVVPSLEPTAFIFHVSRCGSTLLTQLLSIDNQYIVLSEPPILDDIMRNIAFQKPEIPEEEIDKSIKSIIKLLGKKRTGNETQFFIKLDSWHIFFYEKLRKLYPKTPFIFSFRRPDEVIRSQIQETGMHAAPGVIQPALFGFELMEILNLTRPVYVAKVLEKYFEIYLKIKDIDQNTLFLDYKEGILISLNKIQQFLNLNIDEATQAKIEKRSKFHSKRPNFIFDEKPLDSEIPDYQQYVFSLYEKLNDKL